MGGLEIASLYAKIGADTSGLEKGLGTTKTQLSNLDTAMSQLKTGVTVAFAAMGAAAVAMAANVVKTGFEFLAMKEQAEIAFTTMLGSGEKAQDMLSELQAFAAKTPFEFPDLIRASQRLMAMGFSATEVIPTLTAVGDAVAALGGNAATIDRVTTALGQMNAKGKTSAEEMMQLTEAGIPAWQMLADKIGVSVPEAMAQVSKGAVSAQTTISAVVDGIETKFGGMMEKQSTTWNGLLSNLKDNFTQMSGTVMKPFFDMAKVGLGQLVAATTAFSAALREGKSPLVALQNALATVLPPEMLAQWNKFISILGNTYEGIKAIVKPIIEVIGKFVKWQDVAMALGILLAGAVMSAIGALVAAMWPLISTIALVTAAVAAARAAWESDFMGIRTYIIGQVTRITEWFKTSSGLWQGTWQDSFMYIADIVVDFVKSIPFKLMVMWWDIDWQARHTTDIVMGIVTEWVDYLIRQFNHWKSVAVETFAKTKDKIIENWNLWIAPTLKNLSDWISITKSHINTWVIYYVDKITKWKEDMIARFQPVFDWWEEHVKPWIDYGRDIIQGLWDGMKETWKRFADWTSSTWEGWVNRFKNIFGIHSPSTLFAGYGKNMMQGLAGGIDNTKQIVFDALGGLSTGITSDINVAPSYAGADTAPTEDATLLRAVVEELRMLRATLAAKSMTANVNISGGGSNIAADNQFKLGLRGA